MMIMRPSITMNTASSLTKSAPVKPPESSTHLYTLRAKMVTVATARPMRKALKRRDWTSGRYRSFFKPFPFHTWNANKVAAQENRIKEKTWKARPASMMYFPISLAEMVFPVEAIPPPTACKIRLIKSQLQKTMV